MVLIASAVRLKTGTRSCVCVLCLFTDGAGLAWNTRPRAGVFWFTTFPKGAKVELSNLGLFLFSTAITSCLPAGGASV